ncbi:pectinesterase-like [Tripterygium wilfordii]|uniref:Pectinesterase n=1 Tax=Tripterygium wilfordii TaxID=458696 RepID=A0A7J7CFC2_TRIWF|nr:pectinesterase-like [Tripterygium wilfordii]KAF5732635.1 pectinesterase-like [Tripterygium wilfordii]
MNNPRRRRFLLLLLLPISIIVLVMASFSTPKEDESQIPQLHIHKHTQIANSACEGTLYPQLCVSTLVSVLPDLPSKATIPHFISATINRTMYEIRAAAGNCIGVRERLKNNLTQMEEIAISDCLELFNSSLSELKSAVSDLAYTKSVPQHYHDLQTLLSGAMTNQYTCLDGFADGNENVRDEIKFSLYNVSQHLSNSLAMLKKVPGVNESEPRNTFSGIGRMKRGYPSWLSVKDRKLLQAPVNSTQFDLTVAMDGTGNFSTIGEAVDAAPKSSTTRFVIYIKAGAYFENVEVERKKTMLMFVGDGIEKTVVKASRNVVDGWTTFRSATVAVVGNDFIAKGITFENSAGPTKHQAVALRSGADFSAFYQCSFVGYQDTLYVHSLRQFYRECDVYGTVDFIFGNAAAVFQNCNLYARKPNENQKNMFTAQGREDPNQNTGISILNSKIAAATDLIPVKSSFKTYLGRPWKEYSRTVIMRSYIDDSVDPAGWLEWNATFALSTLCYGEYMNRGPGSNTSARVTWPGYRVINSSTEANQFTVEPFIQGNEWLNSTEIPFLVGLMS